MKRSIAILSFAAAALVATGALAENTASDHFQRLTELWKQQNTSQTATKRSPVSAASVQTHVSGADERRGETNLGPWADNWRGGMKFEPAGH